MLLSVLITVLLTVLLTVRLSVLLTVRLSVLLTVLLTVLLSLGSTVGTVIQQSNDSLVAVAIKHKSSTRWVRWTLSRLCPLSSNQRRQ